MNNEIVIPVQELKDALPGLNKIVGNSRNLPVLQSVRVSRNAEGEVTITATDLDCMATFTVKDTQPGPAVDMLVPLEQLIKTVKSMKVGTIGLVPEGKEKVKLRYSIGGNLVEQNINTLRVDEFPPALKVNQPSVPLEIGFGAALRQALECCSDDSSRAILSGAFLDVTDKKFHYVVGTNGRFLYTANSFCFDLQKSIIIPDSKFLEWPQFMDDEPSSLSMEPGEDAAPAKDGRPGRDATPGWVKLESGQWTFITKEVYGTFPDWKQVVPVTDSKWTRVTLSDQAIKQLLLVAPNLPGNYSPSYPVRLRITANHLNVEGHNKDEEEWTSIPIDAEVQGKPVHAALNRNYLLKALRFGLNQIDIEDPLSPIVFSKGGKKMVIMPVNLDGSTRTKAATATQPNPEASTSAIPTTPPEPTAPQEEAETKTEKERTATMPRTPEATTPETAPVTSQPIESPAYQHHGNGNNNGNNGTGIKSLVEHVEQIKDDLKTVIRNLSTVIDAVKAAEKEKRTNDKDIDAIRSKLRQIQNVTI